VGSFSSNISIMRRSVSSPDQTPRRELKIRRVAEYFWLTSRCFTWWWNTVSNAWYYFSNKMILEGEIKDAKMSSFSSVSKHSLNINFLCIFFMNYWWVWEKVFQSLEKLSTFSSPEMYYLNIIIPHLKRCEFAVMLSWQHRRIFSLKSDNIIQRQGNI